MLSANKLDDQDLLEQSKVHTVSDSPLELIDGVSTTWINPKHGYDKEDEQESLQNLEKETARPSISVIYSAKFYFRYD